MRANEPKERKVAPNWTHKERLESSPPDRLAAPRDPPTRKFRRRGELTLLGAQVSSAWFIKFYY